MKIFKKYLSIIFIKLFNFVNILIFLPIFFIFLPIALFKKIRFYQIGYFLGEGVSLKLYLCRKSDQLYKKNLDIFFIKDFFKIFLLKKNISNIFWLEIISKNILPFSPKNIYFFIVYNFIVDRLYKIIVLLNFNFLLIKLEDYHGYFRSDEADVIRYKNIKEHLIKIPEEDLNKCKVKFADLNKFLNIKEDQEIITFCNRDNAYKKFQLPHMDLTYHNFRNFPVQDYELCIENLAKKNLFLIRMGNITEKKNGIPKFKFF